MTIIFKRCSVLLLVLASFVAVQLPVYAQLSKPVSLTLQNAGYKELLLEGVFGSASAFLAFPSNWVVTQDVQVNLVYTASPILNRERSTLTVRVNDENVFTLHPIGDGVQHTATFSIPRNVVTPITYGIRLEFNGYLRLTTNICEEPNDPGQWLTISNQTEFVLPVQESVAAPQLNELPGALVVQRALFTPPPVVFVLPDKWNTTMLSTAAQVAARLGKGISGKKPSFAMVRTSDLTTQLKNEANLVIIGKPSDWPAIPNAPVSKPAALPSATPVKGLALTPTPTLIAPSVPPSAGYVRIINSPWNPARKILLINGSTEAELAQIATVFANDARFALMQGPAKSLDALVSGAVNPTQPNPWLSTRITFEQLGEGDRLLSGNQTIHSFYDFRLPDGWLLEPGAQLTLNVANSPALTSEVSHVAVYANNILIGAVSDARDGKEQQVALNLPVDRLQGEPGGKRTQNIEFHLVVFNTWIMSQCQAPSTDSVAWTRINATSFINVPHRYMALPDLQAFPYPFLNDKESIPVVIVLPKTVDNVSIGDALTLAAMLGSRAMMELNLSVATSDQVTQDKYANAHLIVLGAKNNQPLFDKFTQSLASSKSDSVVSAFKNPDYGILYEIASPWNSQRTILLVSSGTDAGYTSAFRWLVNNVPPVDSSGSIAVVEPDQAPRVIYQAVTPGATPTSTASAPQAATAAPTAAGTMASTIQP